MEHFPVACSKSHRTEHLTITNNDGKINVDVLTHMWGHFQSKKINLEPSLLETYENIAKPLFEEFTKYKYSQIVCSVVTEPNDEKGITLVKNKKNYISLDIANKFSFQELTKDMCKRAERLIIIELYTCSH